jgi:hypothetical protein
MNASKPVPSYWRLLAWAVPTVLLLLAASPAYAQRPATAPRPTFRMYQRPIAPRPMPRPMVTRPVPVRPMVYPRMMPVPRPSIRPLPRPMPVRAYVPPQTITPPQTIAPHSFVPYTFVKPSVLNPNIRVSAFQPRSEWLGSRAYFNSFLFGGFLVNDFGYWQPPQNYQMLPLGFGLWPACDSASIPGSFWTAGPCAGIGDYQSLAPAYQNEYLEGTAPSPYSQPFIFLEEAPGGPSAQQPSAPEKKANMVVCLRDGRQLEVSDWWVTEGRFFFIPISGPSKAKAQSVDLNTLDLKKTIDTNEQRGRTFMLNFTPPSERPVLPPWPSK